MISSCSQISQQREELLRQEAVAEKAIAVSCERKTGGERGKERERGISGCARRGGGKE